MTVPDVSPVVGGGVSADVLGFSISLKKKRTHVVSVRKKSNHQFFFSGEDAFEIVTAQR